MIHNSNKKRLPHATALSLPLKKTQGRPFAFYFSELSC